MFGMPDWLYVITIFILAGTIINVTQAIAGAVRRHTDYWRLKRRFEEMKKHTYHYSICFIGHDGKPIACKGVSPVE